MDKLCRIRDLQRAVNQFEAAFEKRYGICLNEGMALCSLSNAERMCPGRLGELLGLTPSNTSKVLRSAESKGLVLRELCCKDRRQMHYSLTTKGRELLRCVREKGEEGAVAMQRRNLKSLSEFAAAFNDENHFLE